MVHAKEWCENILDRILKESKSYHGNSLEGLRPLFAVEGDRSKATLYAPYWVDALQRGRGRWGGTNVGKKTGFMGAEMTAFQIAIYKWMEKHNAFNSDTPKGKINDARFVAWHINQHGTKHFQEGKFIDVYDTIIKQTSEELYEEVGRQAMRITSQAVEL